MVLILDINPIVYDFMVKSFDVVDLWNGNNNSMYCLHCEHDLSMPY